MKKILLTIINFYKINKLKFLLLLFLFKFNNILLTAPRNKRIKKSDIKNDKKKNIILKEKLLNDNNLKPLEPALSDLTDEKVENNNNIDNNESLSTNSTNIFDDENNNEDLNQSLTISQNLDLEKKDEEILSMKNADNDKYNDIFKQDDNNNNIDNNESLPTNSTDISDDKNNNEEISVVKDDDNYEDIFRQDDNLKNENNNKKTNILLQQSQSQDNNKKSKKPFKVSKKKMTNKDIGIIITSLLGLVAIFKWIHSRGKKSKSSQSTTSQLEIISEHKPLKINDQKPKEILFEQVIKDPTTEIPHQEPEDIKQDEKTDATVINNETVINVPTTEIPHQKLEEIPLEEKPLEINGAKTGINDGTVIPHEIQEEEEISNPITKILDTKSEEMLSEPKPLEINDETVINDAIEMPHEIQKEEPTTLTLEPVTIPKDENTHPQPEVIKQDENTDATGIPHQKTEIIKQNDNTDATVIKQDKLKSTTQTVQQSTQYFDPIIIKKEGETEETLYIPNQNLLNKDLLNAFIQQNKNKQNKESEDIIIDLKDKESEDIIIDLKDKDTSITNFSFNLKNKSISYQKNDITYFISLISNGNFEIKYLKNKTELKIIENSLINNTNNILSFLKDLIMTTDTDYEKNASEKFDLKKLTTILSLSEHQQTDIFNLLFKSIVATNKEEILTISCGNLKFNTKDQANNKYTFENNQILIFEIHFNSDENIIRILKNNKTALTIFFSKKEKQYRISWNKHDFLYNFEKKNYYYYFFKTFDILSEKIMIRSPVIPFQANDIVTQYEELNNDQ